MKLKKVMSLFLALVMSFALAAPAFAAEPGDGDEGIMPLMQLYPNDDISMRSGLSLGPFTTTPGQGNNIRVWFHNKGSESVNVILMNGNTVVEKKLIGAGVQNEALECPIPNPGQPFTFTVCFQSQTSMRVIGTVAIAQYY